VERLHPVTLKEEVSVDIKVATVISADLNTELGLNFLLVEILANPPKSGVAQIARILTLSADIVDVLLQLVNATEKSCLILPGQFSGKDQVRHCCNICLLVHKTRRSRYRSNSESGFDNEEERFP
jgi:hypothetical protein